MEKDLGADRALVASDQAAARLAPSGFDHGDGSYITRDEARVLLDEAVPIEAALYRSFRLWELMPWNWNKPPSKCPVWRDWRNVSAFMGKLRTRTTSERTGV